MKRKLVNEDLVKIKKLLNQLQINGKRVTIDLTEQTVEFDAEASGDQEIITPEGAELQSEEQIIAEILAKSEVPEQTGLRYLQNYWDYFEIENEQLIYSPYNVKLLQTIDQLFARGLAHDEVKAKLDEGDDLFATMPESTKEFARDYFDSLEPMEPLPDYDEDEDEQEADWTKKAFKWSLAALVGLLLIAVGSYQLGFLRPLGFGPGGVAAPEVNGEIGEEREQDENGISNGEEETEPAVPALTPEEITVEVLNGSGAPGVAGQLAEHLEEAGYQVVDVDNADSFDYIRSQLINRLEGEEEAWELLELVPQAELLSEESAEGEPMFTIIIGADYTE